MKPCVAEGSAEGSARGEFVAAAVTVGSEVLVTVGADAVCVWNTEATMVCAPAATVALTSAVGSLGAGCAPQEDRNTAMSSSVRKVFGAKYIIHLM